MDLKIFTDDIDELAAEQIKAMSESPAFEDAKIRVMPDVHAGKGSVIGLTALITNGRVIPNVVGVDIGCGMLTKCLGNINVNLEEFDRVCRDVVPTGFEAHDEPSDEFPVSWFQKLHCFEDLRRVEWHRRSAGTLGGGNHFIEVDVDEDGSKYIVIHSGSRNLGLQIAKIYQNNAEGKGSAKKKEIQAERDALIASLKAQGRQKEIRAALKALKKRQKASGSNDLAYLDGEAAIDYLEDMQLAMEFAKTNREIILRSILNGMRISPHAGDPEFHTVHNYIELFPDGSFMVRKGAISAKENEVVLIPFNMRDGCVIAVGKGNDDWNCSAPHGSGRRLSRTESFAKLSMDEFTRQMTGIYSSSVVQSTLDESPMAYKDSDSVMGRLPETVKIIKRLRPVLNFKAV